MNLLYLCCLINSNAFSNRWTYCHSREYVFYWWKEEKIISSNVGEGTHLGRNRMENTNRILNGTAIRSMKLVKCKGTGQTTQEKEKSHAAEAFASGPALLGSVTSVTLGDWNSLVSENSKIIDILQGFKWLCRLSWNQAGLAWFRSVLSWPKLLLCTATKALPCPLATPLGSGSPEPPGAPKPALWAPMALPRSRAFISACWGCHWAAAGSRPLPAGPSGAALAWLPVHGFATILGAPGAGDRLPSACHAFIGWLNRQQRRDGQGMSSEIMHFTLVRAWALHAWNISHAQQTQRLRTGVILGMRQISWCFVLV